MSRPRPLSRPVCLRAAAVPRQPARSGAAPRQDGRGAARVWSSPCAIHECPAIRELADAVAEAEPAEAEPTARRSVHHPAPQPQASKPAAPQPAAPFAAPEPAAPEPAASFAAPGPDRSILPERKHAEKRLAPTARPGRPQPRQHRAPQHRAPRTSLASSQQPARSGQRGAVRALHGAGAAGPPTAWRRPRPKGPRRVKAATDTRGSGAGTQQGAARLSTPLTAKRAYPDGVECVRARAARVG